MAREKLFSTGELDFVSKGQLMDMVSAWAVKKTAQLKAAAERDLRISEFQAMELERYNAEYGSLEKDLEIEKAKITLVIGKHPDWFPEGQRSIEIDNAEYGYRKNKSNRVDTDKTRLDELKEFADSNGYPFYKETITPILPTIAKLLKSGIEVPGARFKDFSETAFLEAKTPTLDAKLKG